MNAVITKLIPWETPFTAASFPSVGLLIATKSDGADLLKALVAPKGIDQYPKYLVDFGEVIAFSCMEEAYAPEQNFVHASDDDRSLCAYESLESPLLASYVSWAPIYFGNESDSFYHYLIFGGDNNIEVITPNRPVIETISQKRTLTIDYEL